MIRLKRMMKNKLDDEKSTTKVAKAYGFKSHSSLSRFLKEEKREMESFQVLRDMTKDMFPESYNDLLDEYCKEVITENSKSLKCVVEYASVIQNKDLLLDVLNKLKMSKLKDAKELARLYEMDLDVKNGDYIVKCDEITRMGFKEKETEIFSVIVKIKIYNEEGQFPEMGQMLKLSKDLLASQEKNTYAVNSFQSRVNAFTVSHKLTTGDIDGTIEAGKEVLSQQINSPLNINILMNMGNAALVRDYEESMKYLNEAKAKSAEFHDVPKLNQVEKSIVFSKCYWRKNIDPNSITGTDISDLHNKAFAYISNNDLKNAEAVLNSIDVGKLNADRKSFYYFYKGLITGDKEDFYRSIMNFKETGDKHYRQLSIKELSKLGENKVLLEALCS